MSEEAPGSPKRQYFMLRLLPPRSTFPGDMTAEERIVMDQHAAYWKGLVEAGAAIVYGPVFDPRGVYGMGIIGTQSEEDAQSLAAQDPAVALKLLRLELSPMQAILGKPFQRIKPE